jgi:serine/threonine-protein kinase
MANVYLADDLRHGRQVAVKILRPELGAILGPDRFTREIRIAAALSHPHILPLYDSGESAGRLFYVMPVVRGGSLRERLRAERRLPVAEAVEIVRQAAAALDYAHGHALIHRDIKPENILLHEGEAMVTDFGIALAAGSAPAERLTETGFLVGTPEYMSPEQAAGERTLDARSDVYSLGCVLYELLAGEAPHAGPSPKSLIARRFTEPAPRVRRVRPDVPAAVDEAVARALAPDPSDRFPTAAAFAEALAGRVVTAAAPKPPSVAVLPFLNLSPDPENEFFADGITEDVIAQLSKIRALRVISRGSVMRFKRREQSLREIGVALDVGTLVDGSVRRAGSRVRIVAQLLDADTDRHLWSETYDRDLTDIFAIQSDVALQIAGALETELTHEERTQIRREPTDDVEAYQLYLLGREEVRRWTPEGVRQGIRHLEEAVERDPGFALAWSTLAHAYTEVGAGLVGLLRPREAFARAKAAVDQAITLDPTLAEAHAMAGFVQTVGEHDWEGAERSFRRAIELNPRSGDTWDAYGLMLSAVERYDEALAAQRRAHEIDPLSHRHDAATTLLRAGRYEESLRLLNRILELEPDFPFPHATRGWALLLSGRAAEGIASLEQALRLSPQSTMFLAQVGQAYARVGRTEDAREVLRRLEGRSGDEYVSPYHLAYVYAGLGEDETAMDLLERAYEERAGGVYGVKGSFLFASLREHPRFRELLRRMNLVS